MKKPLNILMIGAGGVASYLLPALANSFELTGVLFDADTLEPHNLDRQIFDKKDIGKNKAAALLRKNLLDRKIIPIAEYFELHKLEAHERRIGSPDLVLCVADNHPARRAALAAASAFNIPCFIAANEYATSQALAWMPALPPECDPRIRYPEIQTSNAGSPIRCAGDALESTPQLAIANQMSAALVNWMIWLWMSEPLTPALLSNLPMEFQTTYGKIETIQVSDLVP